MMTEMPVTPQDMTRPRLDSTYVRIINSLIKRGWDDQQRQSVVHAYDILGRAIAQESVAIFYMAHVKPFYEVVGGWDVRYCPDTPAENTSWVFSVPD